MESSSSDDDLFDVDGIDTTGKTKLRQFGFRIFRLKPPVTTMAAGAQVSLKTPWWSISRQSADST